MIKPHGSESLNPLYVSDDAERAALEAEAEGLPSLLLNSASAANAVMLGGGYFNPLTGYMNLADALSVAETMRTTDGLFFPVPVVNMTNETGIEAGSRIALRDPKVDLAERDESKDDVREGEDEAEDGVKVREAREQRVDPEGVTLPHPSVVEVLPDLGAIALRDLLRSGHRQAVRIESA